MVGLCKILPKKSIPAEACCNLLLMAVGFVDSLAAVADIVVDNPVAASLK